MKNSIMVYLMFLLALVEANVTDQLENVSSTEASTTLDSNPFTLLDTLNTTSTTTHHVSEVWNNVTDTVSSHFVTTDISNIEMDSETNTCAQLCSECSACSDSMQEIPRKSGEKIPLYIGSFYAGPGSSWESSGCIPAAEMAFEDVNARNDILPEYELIPIWNDTQVSVATNYFTFFKVYLFILDTRPIRVWFNCTDAAAIIVISSCINETFAICYVYKRPNS